MVPSLQGKVALITGGSRGIGRGIARGLAQQGATIAFNYFRRSADARRVQKEIEALGVPCLALKAHLGDAEKARWLVEEVVRAYGQIDILVNNAATGVQRPALDLEEKHWDWTMAVNARAPWLLAREAARHMPPGGRVINISSLGSGRVLPSYTAVGVSKAALEALTRYLAVELAPRGIIVNAIAAGLVETEALDHFPNKEEMLETARQKTPAGRLVTPEDVAGVVAFLCSPQAEMLRGQVLIVDGGMSLVL